MPFNPEKLAKLVNSKKEPRSRTGGKGTSRRRYWCQHKSANFDCHLPRANSLNVRDIPAIEAVNLFKDDGNVIHFDHPKVQASIAANTYVVSGKSETKKLEEFSLDIFNELGDDAELVKMAASIEKKATLESDDEIPDLVSFEVLKSHEG